jgi:hypothetical protein
MPLAKHHNIVLEPYSAGRIEFSAKALFSFYSNISDPENSFNLHLNLGIINHNDVGKPLTSIAGDPITAEVTSRQILFGFACSKNFHPFGFALEFTGNSLQQQPPETAYSREPFLYLTPAVSFIASSKVTIKAGMDFRLVNSTDETNYTAAVLQTKHDFDNFPPWRLYFGIQLLFKPRSAAFASAESPAEDIKDLKIAENAKSQQNVNQQKPVVDEKFLNQLAKEKRKTETAEIELVRIREERERVARILEKLKQMIDSKKKKPPPDKIPPEKLK